MELSILHYILLLGGLFLGAITTGLILIQRHNNKQSTISSQLILIQEKLTLKENEYKELQGTLTKLNETIRQNELDKKTLEIDLAVRNEEISQLSPYKKEVTESRDRIISLSNTCSEMDEKLKQYTKVQDQLKVQEEKIDHLRQDGQKQIAQIAELSEKLNQFNELTIQHRNLQEQLKDEQKINGQNLAELARTATLLQKEKDTAAEKITLLNEAKEEMAHRFKTVAQEIFEEKGAKFNSKQEKDLGHLLSPLREQLSSFNKRINDIHDSSSKDQASLRQELETLRKSNLDLNKEARNLTKALKGDQKVQGNWGEMILEKVLEHSGLRKGIEYETQKGLRDDDHKLFKPDVIVHLPEGRAVVIDSKVSLVAYEGSCGCENDEDKQQFLNDHVYSVRKHIKELADKDYSNLPGLKSPDFVLMFMPIEPAFMSAFQQDESLFQYGFERRIIVVTPSTLLATLRTIQNIWQFERQNQNTKEIASRASKIYEKLRLYLASMDDLGKQLAKAQTTYDTAMGRLATGRGNLVNQAGDLVKLGVKVKKEFPPHLMGLSTDPDQN